MARRLRALRFLVLTLFASRANLQQIILSFPRYLSNLAAFRIMLDMLRVKPGKPLDGFTSAGCWIATLSTYKCTLR